MNLRTIKEDLAAIELACRLRNETIVDRINKGEAYHAVAMDYDLTRQRVYKIVAAYKRAMRKRAQAFPTVPLIETPEAAE